MANSDNSVSPNLIISGGLIICGFFVGKKLLTMFGILDDAESKKKKEEEEANIKAALNADVFNDDFQTFSQKCFNYARSKNPNLYVVTFYNNAGYNPYSNSDKIKVVKQAKQIYDAKAAWALTIISFGVVHDHDNVVLGILQQAPTQLYISALNQTFFNLYNQSLIDYCNGFMDTNNVARIEDIIKRKPMYLK